MERFRKKQCGYYSAVCTELVHDVDNKEPAAIGVLAQVDVQLGEYNQHQPLPTLHQNCMHCAICKLEEKWMKATKVIKEYGEGSQQQHHMSTYFMCGIAHSLPVP